MPPSPPRFQYPSKILITFLGDKTGLVDFIAFMHCNNKCQFFPPIPSPDHFVLAERKPQSYPKRFIRLKNLVFEKYFIYYL